MATNIPQQQADASRAQAKSTLMATDIPTDIPLQQQTDAFFAQAKSQVPADLFKDLLSPVEQLITSGAAESVLKAGIIFALWVVALSLMRLLTGLMLLMRAIVI